MAILYDFQCTSCKVVFEALAGMSEKEVACVHCGAISTRQITPVNFDCGRGIDPDFPTAYAKWGNKRRADRAHKWGRVKDEE